MKKNIYRYSASFACIAVFIVLACSSMDSESTSTDNSAVEDNTIENYTQPEESTPYQEPVTIFNSTEEEYASDDDEEIVIITNSSEDEEL